MRLNKTVWAWAFFLLGLVVQMVLAEVPSSITYQGRLYRSGVGAAGSKQFSFSLVSSSGTDRELLLMDFPVTIPVTGEFSVVIPVPDDYDWAGKNPRLEVSVDGEKLTPSDLFSSNPYSLVTKKVDINGVNTAAIQDGAVTSVKVSNVSADKVLLGSGQSLSHWEKGTTGGIDAAVIIGTVPASVTTHGVTHLLTGIDPVLNLSPKQMTGTAVVLGSTQTQVMESVGTATDTFVLKGFKGAAEDKFYPLRVYGTQTPNQEEQFRIRGDGQTYFKGNVGIGTTTPVEKLTVVGNLKTDGDLQVSGQVTSSSMTSLAISVSSATITNLTVVGDGSIFVEPWHEVNGVGEPTFKNGWANYTGDTTFNDPISFCKDAMGFVHLKGILKSPGTDVSKLIVTLPVEYRPKKAIIATTSGADVAGHQFVVRLAVYTDGSVYVNSFSGVITTSLNVYFSGINYRL